MLLCCIQLIPAQATHVTISQHRSCPLPYDQETLDPFWTEPESCTLPGETFPARGICGGLQGVAVYDLVPEQGSTDVGARLLVFQTPAGKLHATFRTAYPYILNAHGPDAAAQAPGGGYSSKAGGRAAAAAHVSLGVWNSRLAAQVAQYRDLVSEPGRYSCVSVTVDLAATCDPLSSVASLKGGCSCGSERCATKSLVDAQMLYLAPSIMLSNASGGADGAAVAFKAYGAAADGVVSYQAPGSCRDGGAAGTSAVDDAAGTSTGGGAAGGSNGPQRQAPVTLELYSGGAPIFSLRSCDFLTELLATTANGRRFRSPPSCLADGASLAVTFQMASQGDAAAVASKLKQGRDSLASALGMTGRCGARITVSSASISTFDGSNTAALRCPGTAAAGAAGTTARAGSGRVAIAAGGSSSSSSSSSTARQALSGPHVRVSATRATADFSQADCMPLMARIIPAATAEGYTSLQCKASGRTITGTVSFSSAQQAQQAAGAVVGSHSGQALARMASELKVCSGSVVVYYNIKAGGVEEKVAGLSRGPC